MDGAIEAAKGQRITSRLEFSDTFPRKQDSSRRCARGRCLDRRLRILITELRLGLSGAFLGEKRCLIGETRCVAARTLDVETVNVTYLANCSTFAIEFG